MIVDTRVDFRAQPIHQAVKSAERRQINGRGLQRFDRSIDEVRRVAHGFGRFQHSPLDQKLGRVSISRDRKIKPHRCLIAVRRLCPAQFIERRPHHCQPKLYREMGQDAGMDFLQCWEASEIPARFQQRRQHQATRVTPSAGLNEGKVCLGQVISHAQLFAG
jgi:hypothetical protein